MEDGRSWTVHLLGYPAAGKRTVGTALVGASERAGDRFVLIDNHLSSNAILAVLDGDGGGRVGDQVWDLVDEVRQIVDRAILELAPPERSFIFTNSAMVGDVAGERSLARVRTLARSRDSTYVPVVLRCERDELLRRVPNPDRRAQGQVDRARRGRATRRLGGGARARHSASPAAGHDRRVAGSIGRGDPRPPGVAPTNR